MTAVLGIDPGNGSGACVLLAGDGRLVLYWLAYWRRGPGAYAVTSSDPLSSLDVLPSLARCSARAVDEIDGYQYAICLEQLFALKGGKASAESILTLGEACGEFLGPLAASKDCQGRTARPRAREDWRPAVLGLTGAKAQEAEAYAFRVAPSLFAWPQGWPQGLRSKEAAGALAEAACIARWGVTCSGWGGRVPG